MLENAEAGKTSKYVVQELQDPQMGSPEFQEMYKRFSKRILWMDGNVVEGAFQMNTAWYFAVPDDDPVFEEHCHNSDEIIGFYGSDPEHPFFTFGGAGAWRQLVRFSSPLPPSIVVKNSITEELLQFFQKTSIYKSQLHTTCFRDL